MKIAFVSFEYPPETAFGGIATYVEQAAIMLAARGHHLEVFAGGHAALEVEKDKVRTHRIACLDSLRFYQKVYSIFEKRHREIGFDVVESPDYKHDGYWVAKKLPQLPHVVRLHSGTASSSRLFRLQPEPRGPLTFARRGVSFLRAVAGACRRGEPLQNQEGFIDYLHDIWNSDHHDGLTAKAADIVVSPSLDLLKFQIRAWSLDPNHVALLPNVYSPARALLEIPAGIKGKTIGYFGQMSERKGLRALGDALPFIFARHPDARFKFVGRDYKMSDGRPWPEWLREKAGSFASQLEFVGHVALADMAAQYAEVDVCVFPSIWENFPNVCLEAMSAGRAVAGSWSGGMAEMLDNGHCGRLFPPQSPEQLARAVFGLLENPDLCLTLGERARARVLACYHRDVIAPQQEELYRRAIAVRKQHADRLPA